MATTRLKGIWIPENIIFDTDLSTTEKFVLSVILYLSENEKCCFASNRYIASIINVSTGRASKIISKLKARDYVEVKLNYKTGSKEIENRVIIPIVKNANTYNCERLSPIATNNYISGQKERSPIVNKCKDIKRNITNKNNYIEREYPDEYWNQFYVN